MKIAFQSINKFEGKSDPKTWLFGILNHKIADHFRKIYHHPVVNESDRNPEVGKDFLDTFFDANESWINKQWPKSLQPKLVNIGGCHFKKCH